MIFRPVLLYTTTVETEQASEIVTITGSVTARASQGMTNGHLFFSRPAPRGETKTERERNGASSHDL